MLEELFFSNLVFIFLKSVINSFVCVLNNSSGTLAGDFIWTSSADFSADIRSISGSGEGASCWFFCFEGELEILISDFCLLASREDCGCVDKCMFAKELKLDVFWDDDVLIFRLSKLGMLKAFGAVFVSANPPKLGIVKVLGAGLVSANPPKLGIVKAFGVVFVSANPPKLGIVKALGAGLVSANPPKLGIVKAFWAVFVSPNPPKEGLVKALGVVLVIANPPKLGILKEPVLGLLSANPPKPGIVKALGLGLVSPNPPKLGILKDSGVKDFIEEFEEDLEIFDSWCEEKSFLIGALLDGRGLLSLIFSLFSSSSCLGIFGFNGRFIDFDLGTKTPVYPWSFDLMFPLVFVLFSVTGT